MTQSVQHKLISNKTHPLWQRRFILIPHHSAVMTSLLLLLLNVIIKVQVKKAVQLDQVRLSLLCNVGRQHTDLRTREGQTD